MLLDRTFVAGSFPRAWFAPSSESEGTRQVDFRVSSLRSADQKSPDAAAIALSNWHRLFQMVSKILEIFSGPQHRLCFGAFIVLVGRLEPFLVKGISEHTLVVAIIPPGYN